MIVLEFGDMNTELASEYEVSLKDALSAAITVM